MSARRPRYAAEPWSPSIRQNPGKRDRCHVGIPVSGGFYWTRGRGEGRFRVWVDILNGFGSPIQH